MGTNGTPQAAYIEFKNVSKSFGDNHVLDNVNFNVMAKETVCILGRSGVGKSVALHHIMGFLKPDSGRVIVAFEDITDYPEEELERIRQKVTMVFQNGALKNHGDFLADTLQFFFRIIGAYPPESHHGFSKWRVVRFAHRPRERGLPAARAW